MNMTLIDRRVMAGPQFFTKLLKARYIYYLAFTQVFDALKIFLLSWQLEIRQLKQNNKFQI